MATKPKPEPNQPSGVAERKQLPMPSSPLPMTFAETYLDLNVGAMMSKVTFGVEGNPPQATLVLAIPTAALIRMANRIAEESSKPEFAEYLESNYRQFVEEVRAGPGGRKSASSDKAE